MDTCICDIIFIFTISTRTSPIWVVLTSQRAKRDWSLATSSLLMCSKDLKKTHAALFTVYHTWSAPGYNKQICYNVQRNESKMNMDMASHLPLHWQKVYSDLHLI